MFQKKRIWLVLILALIFMIGGEYLISHYNLNIVTKIESDGNQYKLLALPLYLVDHNIGLLIGGGIGIIIFLFLIIEKVLANYEEWYYLLDNGFPIKMTWCFYYFSALGIFIAIFFNPYSGILYSKLVLYGIIYLFIACFATNRKVPLIIYLITLLINAACLILGMIVAYIVVFGLIAGMMRALSSAAHSSSKVSAKKYNEEAEDLEMRRTNLRDQGEHASENDWINLRNDINQHNWKDV